MTLHKAYVLLIGRVLVATVPSAPNPPVDQCAKGDFGVYFPEYAKVPLPFIYRFWYFRETRPNPDLGFALEPSIRGLVLIRLTIVKIQFVLDLWSRDGSNPAETQAPQGGTIKVLLPMHPPLIDWCLRIRFGFRLHLPLVPSTVPQSWPHDQHSGPL